MRHDVATSRGHKGKHREVVEEDLSHKGLNSLESNLLPEALELHLRLSTSNHCWRTLLHCCPLAA